MRMNIKQTLIFKTLHELSLFHQEQNLNTHCIVQTNTMFVTTWDNYSLAPHVYVINYRPPQRASLNNGVCTYLCTEYHVH
jgi:hypothetical protein